MRSLRRRKIDYARFQGARPTIHRALAAVLVLGSSFACLAIVSVILTLRASGSLEHSRSTLDQARAELAEGSFAQAASTFEEARAEFDAARDTMHHPFVSIAASIPLIGRTPDAIRDAAEAGLLVTAAGEGLSSAVGRLRGGLEALSLSGERIPVRALEGLHPAVLDALSKVEDAERLADTVATTFVPSAIADAGDQLRSALHRSVAALTSADAILRALPEFAGMERPHRYFLVPQDPAELRGTGGSFSYWAILKIERGRISLQPFHYIDELPGIDRPVWPSKGLEAAYGSVNAAGDWDFANAPADGPTAAGFISHLWEQTGNKPIDGVIMIDAHALGSLLEATGPVRVGGLPFALTSDNVVSFVTNGAYLLPGGGHVRRGYVGLAGLRIFQSFLAEAKGYAAIRSLVDATAGGHILLNATDPALQTDFQIAEVTGAIAPASGDDVFAFTINNLADNRVDFYVSRTINYDVTLLPDGQGRATASVTFENDSPLDPATKGLESLLLPHAGPADLDPGEAFEQATINCGRRCRLTGSTVDGDDVSMTAHVVRGLQTVTGTLRTPPQGSSTLTIDFDLGNVWHGDGAQGTYALSIPTQSVIVPTVGTVTIHAPSGMTIAAASTGMLTSGSTATWRGSMSDVLALRVRFQRSTLGRIWWGLKSLL
ncbi:MAG: DUF4012 domain-containing protein [Actinomycetota bacterium]